ncbi:assimilatory nitrite reductase (NAD(P)H) small subunit [Crenobacter luteus]|uniref:Nitrite reductase n=1 Tax=Crenobacter luteus TaxID=1452487 RepID=A0A163CKW8_9NEIS|nr:nitrite reductase small subunit NirD [Crenobacter luteus]KZE32676.1 nitrite reductase [Crenobacter luteus]TCP12560.1 assimilatory nitrite reductase (NAD(P)H) small subunit [Crenobacter luteus]
MEANNNWKAVCALADIPKLGSRVVRRAAGDDIALFRTETDAVFALTDRCPHKGGPLSQGLVVGEAVVCPLHGWAIQFSDGHACAPDEGCTGKHPVKVVDGVVWLSPV